MNINSLPNEIMVYIISFNNIYRRSIYNCVTLNKNIYGLFKRNISLSHYPFNDNESFLFLMYQYHLLINWWRQRKLLSDNSYNYHINNDEDSFINKQIEDNIS